jgi:hypothetical protein
MDKIWYIYIDGKKEGPYDIQDLRRHPKVTPDTLAWKQGFRQWVPLRSIFELIDLFKDEDTIVQDEEEDEQKPLKTPKTKIENDTLALRYEPPASYFWIFVAILIIVYTVYLIYKGQR